MAPCMSIGQAAGTAAAVASKRGVAPRQLSGAELRKLLLAQAVRLLGA